NAPIFRVDEEALNIAELTTFPGSRFPLEGASDADIGVNAQLTYTLSPSDYFSLDQQGNNEQSASLSLVLTKSLDRETIPVHRLVLTATDGGRPPLTGTMELVISVLDANDNAPQFNQSVYKVKLLEGSELGTRLITLSATDADEGINSDIIYLYGRHVTAEVKEMFSIDEYKGEIKLQGKLDYEERDSYEITVEARDKGSPPLSGHCKVLVEVLDVNDNAPEVWVTSLSVPVAEDASVGTVVALLSVSDRDSGANGRVRCWVWPASPFGLEATFAGSYSLVLREALDRERVSEYEVEVRAEDGGAPALRASRGLRVPVSDVNDNAPAFAQAVYTVLARENNAAGAELARLWARDPDEGNNGRVSYSVAEGGGPRGKGPFRVGLYSGEVSTARALEEADGPRQRLVIVVRDHGEPARSATATLSVSLVEAAEAALAAAAGSSSSSSRSAVGVELGAGAASAATNVWLVVAICAVSSLFLLAVVLYGASRWAPRAAVLSGPGPTTLVCASEVGSWSYSQRHSRSLCVADGAGKSDLMVFSPNFPPPP
ncbi:PCDA1 protein, partial [Pomatostomus ruficeps]|nr:PCDA1 protein [Pomatostomus ruficeps]